MQRVLHISLFQPFVQYRNPFTFYYAQSYPLPPPSTVYGLLMYITKRYYDEKIYDDYKIKIFGNYESQFFNYLSMIKATEIVGNCAKTGGSWLPLYFSPQTSQRTPVYQMELFNVRLHLFIAGDNLSALEEGFKENPIVLGRGGDVAFIRKIDYLEITTKKKLFVNLKYGTYVKKNVVSKYLDSLDSLPIYYTSVRHIFYKNNEPIKSIHELDSKTIRKVNFEKLYYLPANRRFEFDKPIDVLELKVDDEILDFPLFE